jgi:hypothetical protein
MYRTGVNDLVIPVILHFVNVATGDAHPVTRRNAKCKRPTIFKYLQVPCLSWRDDQLFDFRNVTTMNPQRTSIVRKEFYYLYYPTIDSYPPARWSCPCCESFPDICGVCPHFTSGTWITINPSFCLVIHDNPNVTWCRLPRTWDVFQTITGRRWPDLWSLCGDCGQGGKGWEGAPLPF